MSRLLSLTLHTLAYLLFLYLGFCFSRLFYFSPPPPPLSPSPQVKLTPLPLPLPLPSFLPVNIKPPSPPPSPPPPPPPPRPITGRHAILVRPWSHPNPIETLRAHRILSAVQSEQRRLHISPNLPSPPRNFLVITPTYSRTFQTLHLNSLAHSLLILPFPFTWILVEPHGSVNSTSSVLARFPKLNVLRLRFDGAMPDKWESLLRVEAQMRLLALSEIRERRLEGIIVFADESNIHSMEFFDEAQKIKWIGLASIGILAHSGPSLDKDEDEEREIEKDERKNKSSLGFPVMGPACNKSGRFIGYHSFDSSNYTGKIGNVVGEEGLVLPAKVEWAGFVVDSRLVWDEMDRLPNWVRAFNAGEIENPLDLVKDPRFIEPLGRCGKQVLIWWNRVETRSDIEFPTQWVIEKSMEVIVPAKMTPWPELPPESEIEIPEVSEVSNPIRENIIEKRSPKIGKSSRSRRRARGKRKREGRMNVNTHVS